MRGEYLESIIKSVDLVCITDDNRDELVSWSYNHFPQTRNPDFWLSWLQITINDICRKHQKPFYAGGTYGLVGYIFCDLLSHEYLAP